MNINSLIKNRYSPRAFSDKEVSQNLIDNLFEAARWAPSSRNEQPWRFFYTTKSDEESYLKYFSILNEWNQKWAITAPVIIAAVAKLNSDHKNLPNKHAIYDLGQAVSYFTFQASHMGLYVHQMGGFSPEKAKLVLDLPAGYEVITMIVLGYKGELDILSAEYQLLERKKRERLPVDKLVFKGNQKLI